MSNLDASKLFSVKGLVAVVTGASSGLGEVMAHALDVNGAAKVFILGRRESKLNEVASKAKNGSLIPVVCDVSSKESLQAAVATIEKKTPFINLVIANSGYLGEVTNMAPRAAEQTVEQLQEELWNKTTYQDASKVVSTNIAGSYFTFIAFLGLLGAGNTHLGSVGKSGLLQSQFISTTSFGGMCRAEAPSYIYNASKAALNHLTKTLSSEYARHGIRANAIAPGMFVTEMTEAHTPEGDISAVGSMPWQAIPATRAGTEEDIAGAVLYLASRAGSFVNGCILLPDGGMLSVRPGSY
ncbi:short chain dehydrogenase/reductase family [Naematelia encephala]|uniref:Short chain dehydrogenase/reductase family n=1 Tax=Naematelia encephala TaxID=71784 RepID=A0A1Y2AY36_9TREE|nr:short chain dehydrogenase/reductase family [Naematelia encephala]